MKPMSLLLFVFQCVQALDDPPFPKPPRLPFAEPHPESVKGPGRADPVIMPSQEDLFLGLLTTKYEDFPAIIVSGGVVATAEPLRGVTNISLCNYDVCKPTSDVTLYDEDTGLTYVKIIIAPFLTNELSTGLFEGDYVPKSCLSHAFKRKPVWTRRSKDGTVFCKKCRNMDGFFCDRMFLGPLLRTDPRSHRFDIVPYRSMLLFAERNIINDTQIMREYLEMSGIPPDTEEDTIRSVGLRHGDDMPVANASVRAAPSIALGIFLMVLSILASF